MTEPTMDKDEVPGDDVPDFSPFTVANDQIYYWAIVEALGLILIGILAINAPPKLKSQLIIAGIATAWGLALCYMLFVVHWRIEFGNRIVIRAPLRRRVINWSDIAALNWRQYRSKHELNYGVKVGSKKYGVVHIELVTGGDGLILEVRASARDCVLRLLHACARRTGGNVEDSITMVGDTSVCNWRVDRISTLM
jgi:hypothetical protein